jgi:hypothetical protein
VDAARPELVYLAVRLREERDSRDIDRILQSCRLHLRLSEGDILRAGYECPLLERGLCTAYELRPFTCRGCNSLDASDCRKGFARRDPEYPIRRYAPQAKLADVYRGALTGAAVDAGLRAGPVTLAEGLWTLLQMRMPFRYWLQGGEIRTRRNIVRLRR